MAVPFQHNHNNLEQLEESVFNWIETRSPYVNNEPGSGWVIKDPIVGCLASTLYALEKNETNRLSDGTREQARQIYLKNSALRVWREAQLKSILNAFDEFGIAVMALKGVALEDTLYKDPATRPSNDVDLLVRSQDFQRSVDLLVQNGMSIRSPEDFEVFQQLDEKSPNWQPNALSFIDQQGLIVDLHHNLIPPWFLAGYPLDIDQIWKRSLSIPRKQQNSFKFCLSPYDMLAHMCLHLAIHGMQNMRSYLDIDHWIRNLPENWEWDRFLQIVDQWQIHSVTYHILFFCQTFMKTPFPDSIRIKLDPGWLARWRVRILITPESLLANLPTPGRRYPTLVKLALMNRTSSIIKSLLQLIFPGKERLSGYTSRGNLLAHWLHIFKVVRRGD